MEVPSISGDVHYAVPPAQHDSALPDIENAPLHQPPVLDRVGDQIRERPWLPAVGGVLGAVAAGALALRGASGVLVRIASAVGGALAGAALTLGAGAGLGALRGPDAPTSGTVPVASPDVVADEDLRVMTFNVHGGTGPEGEYGASSEELDRLAATIAAERPDVVLLQEVDRFSIRSSYTDTLEELARRLHPDGTAFTPRGTVVTGRQEGTGILTFNGVQIDDARGLIADDPYGSGVLRRIGTGITGGIRAIGNEVFDQGAADTGTPDYFPRVTTDAMLVTPKGNHVRVLDGHYNWPHPGTDYQAAQVAPVAGLVDGWSGPTLWGADWNVTSASAAGAREAGMLGNAGLRDTFTEAGIEVGDASRRSFGHVPRRDIDRIYVTDQFETRGVHVVPFDAGAPDPSDHHPVVADLHLETSGPVPD